MSAFQLIRLQKPAVYSAAVTKETLGDGARLEGFVFEKKKIQFNEKIKFMWSNFANPVGLWWAANLDS